MTTEPRRLLDGLFALPALRLAIWLAVVATVFAGLFTDPGKTLQFMDDHQFLNWEESDRLSIMEYGQFPAWNPWYCGGVVSTASPESAVYSPDFLLRLFYGVINGRRIAIVLFLVLGMEGFYQLGRHLKGSALSCAFAATVGSTYPLIFNFLGSGWVNFLGFELLPWVLLGMLKGRESVSWRLIGAIALGWIVLNAGTYSAPYTGIAVAFLVVGLCLTSLMPLRLGELKATILSAATVGVGGGILAAAKLVPMMTLMRTFPRIFTPTEVHDPIKLISGYWPVYGIVLLLAIFALFFKDVWARLFFATAAIFFLCAMGHFADWAPGTIMRKLPIVSGLRLPERFMVMFHVFVTLTAARGLTQIEDVATRALTAIWARIRPEGKRSPWEAVLAPALLGVVVAGGLYHYGRPIAEPMVESSKIPAHSLFTFEAPVRVIQEFRQARGNRRDSHIFPFANRGTLYCLLAITLPESPKLRADLPEEEFAKDPAVATVKRVEWTPHAITLHVDAKAPTRVIVNQNWHKNWTASVGNVVSDEGLLGVDVPQGSFDLVLRYRDWSLIFWALVSFGTFLWMLAYLGKQGWLTGRETFFRYRDLLGFGAPPAPPAAKAAKAEATDEDGDDAPAADADAANEP